MKTTVTRLATAAVFTLGVLTPIGIAGGAANAAPASGMPVAAESIGPATSSECQDFLRERGYDVGPQVKRACDTGTQGENGHRACINELKTLGVRRDYAQVACDEALSN